MTAADLTDLMDMDQWEETSAVASIHGPICPCCGTMLEKEDCRLPGRATCSGCKESLKWTLMDSPLGEAWVVSPKTKP